MYFYLKPNQSAKQSFLFLVASIFFLFFLNLSFASSEVSLCSTFLSGHDNEHIQETEQFIEYLDRLIDEKIISIDGLRKFSKKNHSIDDLFDSEKLLTSSVHKLHAQVIQSFLNSGKLVAIVFSQWSEQKIKNIENIVQKKEIVKTETKIAVLPLEFVNGPYGRFFLPDFYPEDATSNLTAPVGPFEITTTPITQYQWVKVMGKNPSYHQSGGTLLDVNGDRILLQPNHPVESVTVWSVLVFANKLSVMRGLKPVYDLSEINFGDIDIDEAASSGILEPVTNNPYTFKEKIRVNEVNEDIYASTGYRLPTLLELGLLTRAQPDKNGQSYFIHKELSGSDAQVKITDIGWFEEDTKTTQPVGLKLPRVFKDYNNTTNNIYDLFGNVSIFAHYPREFVIGGRANLDGNISMSPICIHGGSFRSSFVKATRSESTVYSDRIRFGDDIGFRLVRSLPK